MHKASFSDPTDCGLMGRICEGEPVLPPQELSRMIACDLIPRLVDGVRARLDAPATASASTQISPLDVAHVVDLILAEGIDVVIAHVDRMRSRGVAAEAIYLDLLAPVARRLGEMWEEDSCDFTQVTVGLIRLQQVLRRLSPIFQLSAAPRDLSLRVLLLPTPGEQHTFGLVIVNEFFRRAGWEVQSAGQVSDREMAKLVGETWFAVVGFTLGSERGVAVLKACIRAIRAASCNPHIGVLVGGPLLLKRPDILAELGADATAPDGRDAVLQAHRLLNLLPSPA